MRKKIAILAALLVGLFGVWIYSEQKWVRAVCPPESATNLMVFLEARPHPQQILKFTYGGKTHIEVIGKPVTFFLSLPSGPPAYIFNENGVLVDWSRDVGDNPSFGNRWGGFSNAITISVEESKQLKRVKP
jgi:hypothetical protein